MNVGDVHLHRRFRRARSRRRAVVSGFVSGLHVEVNDVDSGGDGVRRNRARQLICLRGSVAIELVLRIGECSAGLGVAGGHHNLRRAIDRRCGAGSRGSVAAFVDHAAAGDDAVRIFREARQLGKGS